MYKLEIYKGSFDNLDHSESIGQFDEPIMAASYLASLPQDHRYIYQVTLWFIGGNGDWPEDAWDYQESTSADEWLEDYIASELDGDESKLYKVGTRVILPEGYRTRKVQKALCVIDAIRPEPGREYAILRGITSRGVSKSDSQLVYVKLKYLHKFPIRMDRDLSYIPITKTYQGRK